MTRSPRGTRSSFVPFPLGRLLLFGWVRHLSNTRRRLRPVCKNSLLPPKGPGLGFVLSRRFVLSFDGLGSSTVTGPKSLYGWEVGTVSGTLGPRDDLCLDQSLREVWDRLSGYPEPWTRSVTGDPISRGVISPPVWDPRAWGSLVLPVYLPTLLPFKSGDSMGTERDGLWEPRRGGFRMEREPRQAQGGY